MSTKHVRSVADLVRFGAGVKIECRSCGAARSLDGIELAKSGAGSVSLAELAPRLRCARCGERDAALTILPPVGEPRRD